MIGFATIVVCGTVIFLFPKSVEIGKTTKYTFWWEQWVPEKFRPTPKDQ